ncbi:MAG: serine protease [Thermoleophilaceae bacterium]|nr:serine protease [Thermoleophilaceae bacterium]
MRRASVLAAAVAVLTLALAQQAQSFQRFPNYHWPSHTIRYFDATGKQYRANVAQAAQAWNKSGVKVHWSAVKHRGSGVVPLTVTSNIPSAGLATYYFSGGRWQGKIEVQPGIQKGQLTKAAGNGVATQVFVHEMGHIMGLDHETKVCAIMQPIVGGGCPQPKIAWQYRCRLLESDDLRGGIAIFGGKIGKLGPEYCDSSKEPPQVTGVTAAPTGDGGSGVTVSWTNPTGSQVQRIEVLRRKDACPTGADDKKAEPVGDEQAKAGQPQFTVDQSGFASAGSYCYAVVVVGDLGRPGKPATVNFQYTGPVAPPVKPSARFFWEPISDDGKTISFSDSSSVSDGQIKAWQWDFGDGTGSLEQNPTHVFGSNPEYTVTLTVTDDQGRTDTTQDTVYIDQPVGDGSGAR